MTHQGLQEDAIETVRTDSYSYVFSPYAEPVTTVRTWRARSPRGCASASESSGGARSIGRALNRRPMEDAARIAWVELIAWLVTDYGFGKCEAYQLLTHAGRMRVGNMVDPLYSVVAKIDKALILGQ